MLSSLKKVLLSVSFFLLFSEANGQGADSTFVTDTASKELGGVLVRGSKPLIEVQRDKLLLNVEGSIVAAGSTALDILSRAPGVRVDVNDAISLRGRSGVAIWIDGRPSQLSGQDLATVLRSMPANQIEKIEIITNPSARYDAAGSSGIINIRTKKEKKQGTNGTLNSTVSQGRYPKALLGFTGNHRRGPLNIYGGYSAGYRKQFNQLYITRRFYQSEVLRTEYTQDNYSTWDRFGQTPSLGLDYSPSKKTTVGVSGTGYIVRVKPKGDNSSQVDSGGTTTFFTTTNRSRESWNHYAVNGFMRHSFDSTGTELAVDADYARFWSQNHQLLSNRYFTRGGEVLQPDYILYGDLSGLTQIRSLKADFTKPFKNGLRLETGLKSSYVTADNDPTYFDLSTGDSVYDASRTNHFLYDENINAAYARASFEKGKWSWDLGLRAEQTIAKGDQRTTGEKFTREYTQLFPTFSILRHLNKVHDASVSLSRRIDRPAYQQLNPFKFYLDPTNFRTGNPFLRPALTWSVELTHTYKQKFVTSLTLSQTADVFTEVLQPSTDRPNESFQMDQNLERSSYVGLSISYPIQITKWWSNTTNANLYYNHFYGFLANTPLNRGSLAGDFNTTNSLILGKGFTAEASMYYEAGQVWGYYTTRPVWMLNVGAQKSFFDKKLNLKLAATDLARRGAPRASIDFRDFHETFVAVRDTRVVSLTATYRFGKEAGPQKRLRSGAESEKRRAGGGG